MRNEATMNTTSAAILTRASMRWINEPVSTNCPKMTLRCSSSTTRAPSLLSSSDSSSSSVSRSVGEVGEELSDLAGADDRLGQGDVELGEPLRLAQDLAHGSVHDDAAPSSTMKRSHRRLASREASGADDEGEVAVVCSLTSSPSSSLPAPRVEPGHRLVEDEHGRVHGEYPGYGDAAALPAGERVDVTQPVLGVGEAQGLQALLDAPAGLLGGRPAAVGPKATSAPTTSSMICESGCWKTMPTSRRSLPGRSRGRPRPRPCRRPARPSGAGGGRRSRRRWTCPIGWRRLSPTRSPRLDLERYVPDRLARPRGAFEVRVSRSSSARGSGLSVVLHQPELARESAES